ncbi:hypothetical protein CJF42_00300 [Pseudoalteromonas sp. NBT06-2]|uniref:hypothetical protein n=1 Tax=Pseudoalteromonas sp. NBT06-2 TaxID=2025950 RepID=UPI000BA6AE35|nr:hypothetical protein [Pseudoalteromonas sp. NBT06-2]PAJ76377.1 hypothetical protein CJF42_00300 [Pseudoalteromonas sp. NBT06-2]
MCTTCIALIRKDYYTSIIRLTDAHYVFLTAMQRGDSVQQALKCVAEQLGLDIELVTNAWRQSGQVRDRWFDAGVFINKC